MTLPVPGLEFLAHVDVELDAPVDLGVTDAGHRRIVPIVGGTVTGERFAGIVVPGGADWQVIHADGATTIDTRYLLRAHDGADVFIRTAGVRSGPPEVLAALARGEDADPASYYFRVHATFETSAPQYAWMTRVLTVAVARRRASAVVYDAYTLT
ncbi:DUF3237 domain-containing protein [Actinomycetospora termitidis]|uniref:UPF0311 protein QRT03_14460 n=1 Tax=Actinomycetospora termitidis TaxID=3053470 RepID=A0ABT7MCQ4_9PSEU|nr:DUF3237 domain-containing protein [Actinomycetospora sp. Odt1-22]MDL5157168.1 DUF3237 domain-containing protein [Actinomycetospora sp. Odt1-22]